MPTSSEHLSSPFPTTHWSLVVAAGAEDHASPRPALTALLKRYVPAMQAHLVKKRSWSHHDAEDLIQAFISQKMLQQGLIGQADRSRGKFRSFLLTALDNFSVSRIRFDRARKRAPGKPLEEIVTPLEPASSVQSDAFDLQWAREVIAQTIEGMKEECQSIERPELWQLFERRILAPMLQGTEPESYEQLMASFGFPTKVHATNALVTAKRMFRRIMRQVVGVYAGDDPSIDEEIRDLKNILQRCGAE